MHRRWNGGDSSYKISVMENFLEVKNLKKNFGTVEAVKDISFSLSRGICFGLLGPNGAGKSTTIEMIEQILKPTAGKVLYKGAPINAVFFEELGVQFQTTSLLPKLTVKESLLTFSRFYSKPLELEKIIEICQLTPILNRQHEKLSGGQRQRLLLGLAILSDPELIILDEPTTGLDPQARRNLWELIRSIKKAGKTVILTTHYMDEAYELCDEIAIIDEGLIIEQGVPQDLLQKHCPEVVLEIPKERISNTLKENWQLEERERTYSLFSTNLNHSLKELIDNNVDLLGLNIRQSNLEDLFIKLTGKDLRS